MSIIITPVECIIASSEREYRTRKNVILKKTQEKGNEGIRKGKKGMKERERREAREGGRKGASKEI